MDSEAQREHLKRLRDRELDAQERRGYESLPQLEEEYRPWIEAAVWPSV